MENRKIKIYSDKRFLSQQQDYEPILFPFWGASPSVQENSFCNQFEEYIKNGKNYFEMTSIEDCDFAVYPEKYNKEKIQPFIEIISKHRKPVIIFYLNDSSEKIDIENSYIFRTSLYGKTKGTNEFAMPSWVEDFNTKYFNGILPITNKESKPTVSYCGYTEAPKDILKSFLGINHEHWKGLRSKAVKILDYDKRIKTNFIIRSDFWAGAYKSKKNIPHEKLISLQDKVRKEYVDNMSTSNFSLSIRGNGNFSMRFYEILSMGKIPLFVNTDCVLPYENFINWKKICVWVEDHDLLNIGNKLIMFNDKRNNDQIHSLQKEIYQIYTNWLSPDGFFKNFYKHFEK